MILQLCVTVEQEQRDVPCAGGGTPVRHLIHASCAPREAGISLQRHKHADEENVITNDS